MDNKLLFLDKATHLGLRTHPDIGSAALLCAENPKCWRLWFTLDGTKVRMEWYVGDGGKHYTHSIPLTQFLAINKVQLTKLANHITVQGQLFDEAKARLRDMPLELKLYIKTELKA